MSLVDKSIPPVVTPIPHLMYFIFYSVHVFILCMYNVCYMYDMYMCISRLGITLCFYFHIEPQPVMVVCPGQQIPVEGLANISRYLSRQFCPNLYESLPPLTASQIDSWLDSLSTYVHGNAKEKASVLRSLNATLGTSPYLVGDAPTLCDIVLCPVIRAGSKLGNNVKAWVKRCDATLKLDECMPEGLV